MEDKPLSSAFLLIALSFLLITGAISLVNQSIAPVNSTVVEASLAPKPADTGAMNN